MTNYHVVPRQDEEWAIHEEGVVSRDEARFETKDDAIKHGENLARESNGTLYVQNRMGEIEDKHEFGQ